MIERIDVGGLRVAKPLYDLVKNEIAPGTGIDPDAFWTSFGQIVRDLTPRNRELLAKRDALQARIDEWHEQNPGPAADPAAYRAFLEEIGYLVPEGDDFAIGTENVDAEIAQVAGPQLVVPVSIPRYALNAANARWGSLYDALYGTDVMPEDGGAQKAAPTTRCAAPRSSRTRAISSTRRSPWPPVATQTSPAYAVDGGKLCGDAGGRQHDGLERCRRLRRIPGGRRAPGVDPAGPQRPAHRDPDRPDAPGRQGQPRRGEGRGARGGADHHPGLRGLGRRGGRRGQGRGLPQLARPDEGRPRPRSSRRAARSLTAALNAGPRLHRARRRRAHAARAQPDAGAQRRPPDDQRRGPRQRTATRSPRASWTAWSPSWPPCTTCKGPGAAATRAPAASTSSSRRCTARRKWPSPWSCSPGSRTPWAWPATPSRSASWTRSGAPPSTSRSASAPPASGSSSSTPASSTAPATRSTPAWRPAR